MERTGALIATDDGYVMYASWRGPEAGYSILFTRDESKAFHYYDDWSAKINIATIVQRDATALVNPRVELPAPVDF